MLVQTELFVGLPYELHKKKKI